MLRHNYILHSSAKARTVKTDNFCDPVAANCNSQTTSFDVNKIREGAT